MTLEEADITVEQLMEVRDRSLEENYQPHDVAQSYLEARLDELGFHVEQHGDDARHADQVYMGDGPDVEVLLDGETVAYVEVKSKRVETGVEWFGRCNQRHWNHYVSFADTVDVPVFVWFALVDNDGMIHRKGFVEVEDTDQIDGNVVDINEESVVFPEDAVEDVDGDAGLKAVPVGELNGVRTRNQLVDGIPNVMGNDVVCLDLDDIKTMQWFSHRVSEADDV